MSPRSTFLREFGSPNERRRLRHSFSEPREPLSENHVAYVTRRASTKPRDSPADGGERGAAAARRRGVLAGEDSGVLVSKSGHLVELSRKPTAEQ